MASAQVQATTQVLGDIEIAHIRYGLYRWDGGALFGVVPKTLWSRKTAADDLNRIELAFNGYLLRTGDHAILIETGCGDKMDERARARMDVPPETAPLPEIIARAGFDPESIDIVVNSHLHWDHCGGNTILQGGDAARPAFPRARYFASRPEWEHAHERLARDSVSYIDANYDPLVESGQMMLVAGDWEVAPGIWMRRAPGHNRDMMVITAASHGETFCFLSDLVPTTAHLQPTWVAAFDLYPLESIENKIRWLGAAADGNWCCGFGHEVRTPFARIVRDSKTGFTATAV
ncbi:MAG TPA: MBL fold metallo-hydrolase [Bryobacteraceae bacterium]|nr:MBL fold metallo-hydrolase [Bryobacteraceae bacterium]